MTLELLILGISGFVLLIFLSILALGYLVARQHFHLQQEMLRTLQGEQNIERMTIEDALKQARRLKRSRERMRRLNVLRVDPARYFVEAQENENEINQRLRQLGINPQEIDVPPEIEQLDQTVNGDGILLPPNPTDGRNERVFQQRNNE